MADPIVVTAAVRVPASALSVRAVRASGPGGQNVNKVATRIDLRVDLGAIPGLSDAARARLRVLTRNRTDGSGRLVVTSRVDRLERIDELVTLWNPAGAAFGEAARELGIEEGAIAVTGGQQVFDLFLKRFTQFDLVTVDGVLIPDGVPCFAGGWPDDVLAGAGMRVKQSEVLEPGVRLQVWR